VVEKNNLSVERKNHSLARAAPHAVIFGCCTHG
jgi:hypothetical protein